MKGEIQFGTRQIQYSVLFTKRKTLGITVNPDGETTVKAPEGVAAEIIRQLVKKRSPWIIKQQEHFLSYQPKSPVKKYVSGESHLYLGRQYKLKIRKSKKNEIGFDGRQIIVYHKPNSAPGKVLNSWYRHKAELKFPEVAAPLIKRFQKYHAEAPLIYLQQMKTRWGSCTPKGKIILNPELIKAPKSCIEYVIVHELCHLVYRNHSKKFFYLQAKEMPDWEKWKNKLEQIML